MSLVIWYKVEIAELGPGGGGPLAAVASLVGAALPVTVSNDLLSGSLVLDADITVTMTEGAAADTFELTLVNLPDPTVELIRAKVATTPLKVLIHLGYFDEPATTTGLDPVLQGRLTSIASSVDQDGSSRTVLTGQEEGGYLLRNTPTAESALAPTDVTEFARTVAAQAGVQLATGSALTGTLENFTAGNGSALDTLRDLARRADVPLVVRDKMVYLGPAVGNPADRAPVGFDPERNLVSLDQSRAEDTVARSAQSAQASGPDPGPAPATTQAVPMRAALGLTALGHPGLRVGQVASITGVKGVPDQTMRISAVLHRFGSRSGYTVDVKLVVAEAGKRAQVGGGVQGVVDRWRDVVDRQQQERPAIDVGEVTAYAPGAEGKHLASMHYGQSPSGAVVAPSVASPVDTAVDLHNKPIASPFAFHNCGLITPVYPKMRAVLAHNRGLVNDAVVTGFLWPENPAQAHPGNRAGDYWLALPTQLGPDGLPVGKGANDLTDATGHRVVQVAGIHLLVGADKLPNVGTRPTPPTDSTITIEHQSGTKIAVDKDGNVTITTAATKKLTLGNGQVSLTLDGPSVKVT
ncbi:hypothetical protein BX286_6259 [Streptomyces sp. 3211.6]|uniref:hypothetical protein n=1 Tax=Streptomyces sp. 3211.6 TaxID=1938845 RepID=UPI000EADBEE1|nr:hypothetical protein [Streptomyces sp. 3211.6]RKT08175.1 hypothetical protein BX286_6259 [Streptomyces sp. 3211.6]